MSDFANGNPSSPSLSEEINDIYRNYTSRHDSLSDDHSLDSDSNEPAIKLDSHPYDSPAIPQNTSASPVFVATFGPPAGSETPHSTSSFDFTVGDSTNNVTNSSLNVLLDTPSESKSEILSSEHGTNGSSSHRSLNIQNEQALKTGDSIPGYGKYGVMTESSPKSDDDWSEKGAAQATLSTESGVKVIRRTVNDFDFGKDLGEGSYSTVVLATDKITSAQYAIKILDKRHIIKEKKVKYVNIEKHALNRLSQTNGVISLFFTFQDKNSLYFVLDFASNGELLGLIKKHGTLNEDCTRYLGAQILDAIAHMHINGVIHRDIKPENILLDDKFRIRITDFGTAKLLERTKNGDTGAEEDYPLDVRAKSFVGTAEYVSPELLENKYCGKPGDIWAFGCILYQMIAGKPPFKATNEYLTFQKITKLQYAFSAGFPLILRDLIKQILVLQPSRRATVDQIQSHPFFDGVDFRDPASIWDTPIPPISPYKMNAKSMMKMPPTASNKSTRKSAKKSTNQAKSVTQRRATSEGNGSKNFSAASVAAYVLNKDDDEHEPDPAPPKSTSRPRNNGSPSQNSHTPEYIPGTNILRPQIHTMSITPSTASSKSDRDQPKRPAARIMEITPPTAVEAAWKQFLSPSERVLNVGSAIVKKLPTEAFERRNKGLVVDAPLGLNNKLQSIAQRTGSRSMLSHVVQGNRLRDAQEPVPKSPLNESDAIKYHMRETPKEPEKSPEIEDEKNHTASHNPAKFGKSIFKKLLPTNEQKQHSSNSASEQTNSNDPRAIETLDKARTYTILVSTYGRVLLFLRDDQKTNYKLVCEIKLSHPHIQLKEVVSNTSSKFGKMIPATGVFAIVVSQTTFVFETEKYEVTQWTECLAKAKLNQYEREREEEMKNAKDSSKSSPKLLESPFGSQNRRQNNRTPDSFGSPEVNKSSQHKTFQRDAISRDMDYSSEVKGKQSDNPKRKPPPVSSPTSPVLASNGLIRGSDEGNGGTLHAAQLAVMNNPNVHMTGYRRSSFSRDKGSPSSAHRSPTSGQGGAKITSMNSKFLARTRGKK